MKRKRTEKKVGADGMTAEEIRASGELLGVTVHLRFRGCKQTMVCDNLEHAKKTIDALCKTRDTQ